jgi:hypothetical protein
MGEIAFKACHLFIAVAPDKRNGSFMPARQRRTGATQARPLADYALVNIVKGGEFVALLLAELFDEVSNVAVRYTFDQPGAAGWASQRTSSWITAPFSAMNGNPSSPRSCWIAITSAAVLLLQRITGI